MRMFLGTPSRHDQRNIIRLIRISCLIRSLAILIRRFILPKVSSRKMRLIDLFPGNSINIHVVTVLLLLNLNLILIFYEIITWRSHKRKNKRQWTTLKTPTHRSDGCQPNNGREDRKKQIQNLDFIG